MSEEANWAAAVQLEQCRAVKISALMQAIVAVPIFDGVPGELEFFLKRMDLIVQQMNHNPFDEITNGYILGYFFSRISLDTLTEIGASCDTPWEEVKRLLREKYGGAARSIPRLIIREVLLQRGRGETASAYAKTVLQGFRKVQNRLKDSVENKEELRIRTQMLEELASEMVASNLPQRVRQWVRMVKPPSLEKLVKTVEDEEAEEKEERWEDPRRGINRPQRVERAIEGSWQKVESRNKGRHPPPRVERPFGRDVRKEGRIATGNRNSSRYVGQARPRSYGCWECGESGHFARECPYIYRRERSRFTRNQGRDEPMEVNTTRRRRIGSESGWDSSSSVADSEGSGPWGRRGYNGGRRRNEWPALPVKDKEKVEKVQEENKDKSN